MKAPAAIIKIDMVLESDNFSLKKIDPKSIVISGLDKNKILEIIGLVSFNPNRLKSKAKKITIAIPITFVKLFWNLEKIRLVFFDVKMIRMAIINTINSWLAIINTGETLASRFFQWNTEERL